MCFGNVTMELNMPVQYGKICNQEKVRRRAIRVSYRSSNKIIIEDSN